MGKTSKSRYHFAHMTSFRMKSPGISVAGRPCSVEVGPSCSPRSWSAAPADRAPRLRRRRRSGRSRRSGWRSGRNDGKCGQWRRPGRRRGRDRHGRRERVRPVPGESAEPPGQLRRVGLAAVQEPAALREPAERVEKGSAEPRLAVPAEQLARAPTVAGRRGRRRGRRFHRWRLSGRGPQRNRRPGWNRC